MAQAIVEVKAEIDSRVFEMVDCMGQLSALIPVEHEEEAAAQVERFFFLLEDMMRVNGRKL